MDKNTVIGFVLIAAVLFGFAWWQQPSGRELKAQHEQYEKDSIAAAKQATAAKVAQAKQKAAQLAAATNDSALFHTAVTGTAQNIVLKNSKLELTLSTKGGTVTKAYIKNEKGSTRYVGHNIADKSGKSDDPDGVTLFDGNDQQLSYTLVAKESNISTKDLYFTPSNQTDSTVTLTAELLQERRSRSLINWARTISFTSVCEPTEWRGFSTPMPQSSMSTGMRK